MNNIESNIHEMLLEVCPPDSFTLDEQARIVAAAVDIFSRTERSRSVSGRRSASHNLGVEKFRLMDSLLESMGEMMPCVDRVASSGMRGIDSNELCAEDVVKIASSSAPRFGSRQYSEYMDILNPNDLDVFLMEPKGRDALEYNLNDGEHEEDDLFDGPGGRHWSDSQARG